MSSRFRDASEADIYAITGPRAADIPKAKLMLRGQSVIGMGGIAKLHDGDPRLWAWLDVVPMTARDGLAAVRTIRAFLHELNQDVYLQCDGDFAERMLRLLGFEPTDETKTDYRTGMTQKGVWIWRHWPL